MLKKYEGKLKDMLKKKKRIKQDKQEVKNKNKKIRIKMNAGKMERDV